MEESILTSTKKILNVGADDLNFDLDIITHINSAFSTLNQLGIGPSNGFSIEDDSTEWSDYGVPEVQLHLVKDYIYMKCRLLFDPPGTSFLLKVYEEGIKEKEWRLTVLKDEENAALEEV
jgi:hypothetical protein